MINKNFAFVKIFIVDKRTIIFYVLSVLLIALIPFVFDVYFTTPDDPRYIALVSGAYTGTPEKELVYVGSILGFFEAKLYSFFPDLEWYSIVYYLCTLFAFAAIFWQVLITKFSKWKKISIASLVLISQVYLSLTPQFTTLATQLGFASFVLFVSPNEGKNKYWLSFLLFFFATQFRLVAAFLPYMIAFPLLMKEMKLMSKEWWKGKSLLLGIVFVAFVSFCADKYVYRSDEWKTFNAINDARGYLNDNPMAVYCSEEIKNEKELLAYDLFFRHHIFDLNILTPGKFQEYERKFKQRAFDTIRFNARTYLITYWNMGGWMIALLSLGLIIELVRNCRWYGLFLLGISLSMFMLANFQMMSMSFAKERVMLCSYVALLFSILCIVSAYTRYSQYIVIAVCVITSVQYTIKDYECLKLAMRPVPIVAETESMIEKVTDSKVMLTVPTYLTPEAFHTSKSPIYTKSILQGWMHFYPKGNLKCQPFTAFTDGLPILVCKNAVEQLDYIKKLLKLHYGINSKLNILDESRNYYLVKIEKV
jgi:hypothetical protein